MKCRIGCGACCIAISISSTIPGMQNGKEAGVRCINLSSKNDCMIHKTNEYPNVCRNFKPLKEICGSTTEEAFTCLSNLEEITKP